MTPKRFRDCLVALDLNHHGATLFLEADHKTVAAWARGDAEVPARVAMLLEVMVKTKTMPNDARKLAGLAKLEGLNRPRGRPRRGD